MSTPETSEQIIAALAAAIPNEGKAFRKYASLRASARVVALFDAVSPRRPSAPAPTDTPLRDPR